MHEIVLGRLYQTLKAVSNLCVGLRCQNLNGESQWPDIPLICMRTSDSVDLPTGIEVFVLLGKDKLPRVQVDLIVLCDELEIGKTEQTRQVGVVVESVAA